VPTYEVSKSFTQFNQETPIHGSERNAAVMRMFGLTADRLAEHTITHRCKLQINKGDIVYITGPSGAGKSVLLRELEKAVPAEQKINLADIELACDKTLIECVNGDLLPALQMLSAAGLSDVFCLLNTPANLSDGQKYRFRLACAIQSGKEFIFADEFCSSLDRITAAIVSYKIRQLAKRTGRTFVLASSHDDLLMDLQPDVLVIKELAGKTEVIYKEHKSIRA
jgi:hypothetical protein